MLFLATGHVLLPISFSPWCSQPPDISRTLDKNSCFIRVRITECQRGYNEESEVYSHTGTGPMPYVCYTCGRARTRPRTWISQCSGVGLKEGRRLRMRTLSSGILEKELPAVVILLTCQVPAFCLTVHSQLQTVLCWFPGSINTLTFWHISFYKHSSGVVSSCMEQN